jgi:hypothetical protein
LNKKNGEITIQNAKNGKAQNLKFNFITKYDCQRVGWENLQETGWFLAPK